MTKYGFTAIELTVVLGIIGVLLSLSFVTLSTLVPKSSTQATIDLLRSDLRTQQHTAIAGDTTSGTRPAFGVFFTTHAYTLFQGITYDVADPRNIVIDLPPTVEFASIDLPDTSIVYATGSGEVYNYAADAHTVVVRNTHSQEDFTIDVNQLGVITTP